MTETDRVAGVVPLVGVTLIQEALPEAVNPMAPDWFVTDRVCGAGAVPLVDVKLSILGVTVTSGGPVIVSVTATLAELAAPPAVTPIVPVNVPVPRPAGLTVTSTLPGVVPVAGLSCSQLPGEVAVKVRGVPPVEIAKLCGAGAVPPGW